MTIRFSFLLSATLLAIPSLCLAEGQLEVFDCAGVNQSQFEVTPGTVSIVRVTTSDAFEGTATLSPLVGEGFRFESSVKLNTAVFQGVPLGSWKVCFSNSAVALANVSVGDTVAASESTVVGALALLGGSAALVTSRGAGSAGAGTEASSQLSSVPETSQASSKTTQVSSGVGGAKGVGAQSSNPCYIGNDVEPMSPFS